MKGRVVVEKKDLEARFSWTPDESGSEWDREKLRELLYQADVRLEVSDKILDTALKFFLEHSEPATTEPVVRGLEAVASEPLKVDFKEAPLPGEAERALEEILRDVPKLEGELRYCWAEQGAVIGTVTLPISARPGVQLNREPIPPPEEAEEDFAVGENLELQATTLVALETGILRISPRESDLVPCRLHSWSVDGSAEMGGCFLDYRPGHPAIPPPTSSQVISEAAKKGFMPDRLLPEIEIRSIIAAAVEDGTVIESRPISIDCDGRIEIVIAPMDLRADLKLRRESGNGVPLVLNRIAEVIRNSGLRGIDGPAVKASIMSFWKSGEPTATIVLKEGRAPERSPDRELEFLIPFLDEQDAEPIRERLVSLPDILGGLESLKAFPPETVSRIARVEDEQVVGRLGSAKNGKPGKDIYGKELPGIPGNDPDIQVHEGLSWDGDQIVSHADGVLDVGKTLDGVTHLRIHPHKDAWIRVTVSDDKIKAFVSTRLPVGTGRPVSVERIRGEAQEAGVVKGLMEEALTEIVTRSLSGEIFTGHLIAEGRLPMEGDTRLSLHVAGDPSASPVPVKAGDIIGTIQSGEESGWNVLGEPLIDEGGSLGVGENITRREQDGGDTVLVADKGGHLVMSEGELKINHLLDYVGDVSIATGNIRFPGRIKIDGSVLSRVVIDGGEGVDITQVVQAALVNSGGDITIGKGVKGEGKAVVRSQGTLKLGYAEEANLLSTGNLQVARALMNCRVKCNGRLEFGENEGRLIGGILKLKDGLVCKDVGNERGVETVISFGQDYLVENQIEQVQGELEKIQEFIHKTDDMMADLETKGAADKLIQVRRKKVDAMKILEKKNLRLFLLREKFERHFESEIRVSGTAFPGVTFESHGRILKITEAASSFRIGFIPEKGRLEKTPL
jgi:uncharacterized protein (DUF342 family)